MFRQSGGLFNQSRLLSSRSFAEPETIRLTLNAAESGHLVIASIHAARVEDAIYRICNSFPLDSQDAIRFQLASTLSWVVIQQLLYVERRRFASRSIPYIARYCMGNYRECPIYLKQLLDQEPADSGKRQSA